MLDRRKMKSFALMQLKNRWTVPVIISLILIAVSFLFSISDYGNFDFKALLNAAANQDMDSLLALAKSKQETSFLAFLLSILEMIVTGIISFAGIKVYFQMAKGPEPVSFTDFLKGFNYWGKATCAVLWLFLWIFLWSLLFIAGDCVFVFIFALMTVANEGLIILPLLFQILFIIGFCVLLIYKIISYSFLFYVCAEYENVNVIKAMNLSKQITKNHIGELFVLDLSFLGWIILSAITLGLLNVFLKPYMTLTKINAYHSLLSEKLNNGELNSEDFE